MATKRFVIHIKDPATGKDQTEGLPEIFDVVVMRRYDKTTPNIITIDTEPLADVLARKRPPEDFRPG